MHVVVMSSFPRKRVDRGSVTLNLEDASTWPARSGPCCICLRPSVNMSCRACKNCGQFIPSSGKCGREELLQRSSRVLELECICVESGEGVLPIPTCTHSRYIRFAGRAAAGRTMKRQGAGSTSKRPVF